MNNNFFFIPNKTNINEIDKLSYNNIYNVKDKSEKLLIYTPINYENMDFYIETGYLKIVEIDNNKISLKLDKITSQIFDKLDDVSINLIGQISQEYKDLLNDNIQYLPLNDNDILKIKIDNNTNLKSNNKKINLNEIKINYHSRIIIRIGSLNIFPNDDLCHNRIYVNIVDCKKINNNDFDNKKYIIDYTFSSNENDIFKNIVLDNQDFDVMPTLCENEHIIHSDNETENMSNCESINNHKKSNNESIYSTDSTDEFSDDSDDDYNSNNDDIDDNDSDDNDNDSNDSDNNNDNDNDSDVDSDNMSSDKNILSENNTNNICEIPPKRKYVKKDNSLLKNENIPKIKRKYNKKK
jgi:hypothetical protein